tara:strand:- start:42 stop:638 length:597 start_codon:yes stop_codon:yes gene_type:complete
MEIGNILICGSTYLTKAVVDFIKPYYNLIGYVPSHTIFSVNNIDLPIVDFNVDYDIILSIQYDKKILDITNSYNLHTGLLPDWGGVDILYHTLKSNVNEQGLTFHKINKEFDAGPIVSKITYPIIEGDTMLELYHKLMKIAPSFMLSSLKLLENIPNTELCYKETPTMYYKGNIAKKDLEEYKNFPKILKNSFKIVDK